MTGLSNTAEAGRLAGTVRAGGAARAPRPPSRRGACPSLAAPMETGDGLLARLTPAAPLTPAQLAGGAAAAVRLGNGVVEISARGNLQVRGLDAAGAAAFAAEIDGLGIAVATGVPVLTSPLAGRDPTELVDTRPLVARLRREISAMLAAAPPGAGLGPKVSVVVDGGGRISLDAVAADVRLVADGRRWRLGLAGTAASAVPAGAFSEDGAVAAAVAILARLSAAGRDARVRTRMAEALAAAASAATTDAAEPAADTDSALPRRPHDGGWLGPFELAGGGRAFGLALPFGFADAAVLGDVAAAATGTVVPVPPHGLVVIDVDAAGMARLAAVAARHHLVAAAADPRRRVSACAGAPGCASGLFPARALAPALAEAAAPLLAAGGTLHLSGCRKGCAHPAAADLVVVGLDDGVGIVHDAAATAPPVESVALADLAAAVARHAASARAPRKPPMTEPHDYIRDGKAIYERSFAIIRAEADLSAFSEAEADVAARMIHACGLVEAAAHIAFHPDLVAAARAALQAGAPIFCDAEMVARGVTRARLPAANDVVCTLNDPETPALAARLGTTRSAAAVELWGERLAGAVVAVGNAPTTLFHLIDGLAAGRLAKPAAILGIPVGFVGAAESKAALETADLGVPWLVVRGRMGGSAMAAAAVNALARQGL